MGDRHYIVLIPLGGSFLPTPRIPIFALKIGIRGVRLFQPPEVLRFIISRTISIIINITSTIIIVVSITCLNLNIIAINIMNYSESSTLTVFLHFSFFVEICLCDLFQEFLAFVWNTCVRTLLKFMN